MGESASAQAMDPYVESRRATDRVSSSDFPPGDASSWDPSWSPNARIRPSISDRRQPEAQIATGLPADDPGGDRIRAKGGDQSSASNLKETLTFAR
jgi:hypothetical protein